MTVHHSQMDTILFNMDDDKNQQLAITSALRASNTQRNVQEIDWTADELDLYGSAM
jgi:hypothetical protein